MDKFPIKIDICKVAEQKDLFELSVATPVFRSQFRFPRNVVNQLRVMLEKALME